MAMYVVGANLLSGFWRDHPEAEGELRALHALLTENDAGGLEAALAGLGSFEGSVAELRLRTATVRLEINAGAGIARYAAVLPAEEEER